METSKVSLRGSARSSSSVGLSGFRLGFLLLCGRPLDRVVHPQQYRSSPDKLPFVDRDFYDGTRYLGIDVDVLAVVLVTLDDAFRIDTLGVWVCRWIKRRRLRRANASP